MDVRIQAEKAERFRRLHGGSNILALPNAWDVASARILEEARYPAIATSSAGIAFSLGYADGQRVSRDQMLEVVERIAHAVRSEEHTSELQSPDHLVCRLLLEKKKK